MEPNSDVRLCHLYINAPEHLFERGLKAEAELVAGELTRTGFPMRVQVRYARGDDKTQWQQIGDDRQAATHPDLFVVIPVNQDAICAILSETVSARDDVTCVFLHQPLTGMMRGERERYRGRLFSVAADQVEIGRMQPASSLPSYRAARATFSTCRGTSTVTAPATGHRACSRSCRAVLG
jgi:hypothetical protein